MKTRSLDSSVFGPQFFPDWEVSAAAVLPEWKTCLQLETSQPPSVVLGRTACLPHLNERIIWSSPHHGPGTKKPCSNMLLPTMNIPISTDMFSNFLKCKHKGYLMLTRGPGHKSDYEQLQLGLYKDYCSSAEQHLLRSHDVQAVAQNPPSLSDALQSRYAVILGGGVATDAISCRIDALFDVAHRSQSSNPKYAPALFIRTDTILKNDKLLLSFYALGLAEVQGTDVPIGMIVHGPLYVATKVHLAKLLTTARRAMNEIRDVTSGRKPPLLRLNDHCSTCEYKEQCRAAAIETDDLSLLRGLKGKEYDTLRSKGIFTVTQLSYTFRPRRRKSTHIAKHGPKHYHSLQALAVRTNKVYVAEKPTLPATQIRLYFDVEGVPENNFYYLIGLLACDGNTSEYFPFWADQQSDEPLIWNALLAAVSKYGDCTLYHYGSYDSKWFANMERQYGGDGTLLERLRGTLFNTLSATYSHIYFPTHSNDLKSVASYLGFRWSDAAASGLQSLVWRHEWDTEKADAAKTALLRYNHEDCLALKAVAEALDRIVRHNDCNGGDGPGDIRLTEDIKREHPFRFGRNPFFLPDMEWINRCAYFDYQRERIYIRTSKPVKKSEQRRRQRQRTAYRVNSEVVCDAPSSCPACSEHQVIGHGILTRLVYDLRLMKTGVKRWIVRYRSHRYLCKKCGKTFVPSSLEVLAPSSFGTTLRAWCVYQAIALRQSQRSIREGLDAVFGYKVRGDIAGHLKKVASNYYRSTYEYLLRRIRRGILVHVDETKMGVKEEVGYVWTFTNMEEIVYLFRPTREGDVLKEMLGGFSGVLISDFYTAYDSVPCAHQKCLIHLMRDINDALFKNPFDEDLKQVAQWFTETLRPIIETIDKYGLKRRHLNKHKASVAKFLTNITECTFSSAVAKGYQKRVCKNREMLFTFLDYDGVPWNNNNAEHAIKRFAFLRRVIGSSSTQAGLDDYLVLLSVYETLRLRGISFLEFLVSGITDIDEFAARRRRLPGSV
jgi:predicted RecB family nuclease